MQSCEAVLMGFRVPLRTGSIKSIDSVNCFVTILFEEISELTGVVNASPNYLF